MMVEFKHKEATDVYESLCADIETQRDALFKYVQSAGLPVSDMFQFNAFLAKFCIEMKASALESANRVDYNVTMAKAAMAAGYYTIMGGPNND
jgi:hypothetical protein